MFQISIVKRKKLFLGETGRFCFSLIERNMDRFTGCKYIIVDTLINKSHLYFNFFFIIFDL